MKLYGVELKSVDARYALDNIVVALVGEAYDEVRSCCYTTAACRLNSVCCGGKVVTTVYGL